ncbi:hypothetical protein JCM33374_g2311 [Metschnikowia sp. JCM 33374]|nr:hypothetical protein JCM33374_g2311 [Metschnikowia sp. JCM 33374]
MFYHQYRVFNSQSSQFQVICMNMGLSVCITWLFKNKEKHNRRFKHKKVEAPRAPGRFRDDYHKQKKKLDKAVDSGVRVTGFNKPGQKQELRSYEDIRKSTQLKEMKQVREEKIRGDLEIYVSASSGCFISVSTTNEWRIFVVTCILHVICRKVSQPQFPIRHHMFQRAPQSPKLGFLH